MSIRPRCLSAMLSLFVIGSLWAGTATISIDATKPGPKINPRMYGIFLEEINHGVDGGLYAELIRNRAFEDSRPPEGYVLRDGRWVDAKGFDSGYGKFGYATERVPFWSLVKQASARGEMALEKTGGITEQSAYCLRLDVNDVASGRLGVANRGFFGIGLRQGDTYALSLYARGGIPALAVRLEDTEGKACSDEARIDGIGKDWRQFKGTLTASRTESKARLVITAGAEGRVWLDFVSLFPTRTWKDRPNGLRPDIAQMIADLKPGFVRFPGGCVVEGGTVETAYNWKLTVGPLDQRQECWGPWDYRQTHGMGLYEYLQFCEDLGAEPLWVGFDGQTCHFREREDVPMDQMGWVRDNCLDLVEYANGPADSKWGALRVAAGHAAPFNLKYFEIGNESEGREFEERYRFIYDAMKARYPDLTYLADLSYYRLPASLYGVADMHYYNNPMWFMSRFDDYDNRNRELAPLYLGEVAVTSHDGGPLRGNLLAALAEGVYLMGCERNADAVQMVSYAPLLAHVDGRTWDWHGMIYHDGTRVVGTVSYYLWRLFGTNRPDTTLGTQVRFESSGPKAIAGAVGVGTWGTSAEFKDVRVEKDGKVLYATGFSSGSEGWKPESGNWTVQDGAYRQSRRTNGLSIAGDESWTDYTLTLKARKLSGAEGFLVVFGRKGEDKYWWNIGGWGNTQHAIEFNQTLVGRAARGQVEANRWYDVKVELSGNRIRCSLDGQLIHEAAAPSTDHFFAVAGRDDAADEIVLKAINTSAEPVSAKLAFSGMRNLAPRAAVTTLASAGLRDNNTLDEPFKVVPKAGEITGVGPSNTIEFQPYSLTVIRFKTREDRPPITAIEVPRIERTWRGHRQGAR